MTMDNATARVDRRAGFEEVALAFGSASLVEDRVGSGLYETVCLELSRFEVAWDGLDEREPRPERAW